MGFNLVGFGEALSSIIDVARELYEIPITPANSYLEKNRAHNYALALAHLYQREGDPDDVYKSIMLSQEAVAASPQALSIMLEPKGVILQGPRQEVPTVNTLAARLDERFQLTGSLADLNYSIELMEKLIEAIPDDDWKDSRAEWQGNIAASLLRRYEQDDEEYRSDSDRAVDFARKSMASISEHSPERASELSALANPLGRRAEDTGNAADLDEAIALLREAMKITPAEHPIHIEIGVNLAMRIFQRSQNSEDLEHAI